MASVLAILFLFLCFALGSFIYFILVRQSFILPYSVVIFAIGLGLAFAIFGEKAHGNELITSVELWNETDPNLILFIFLPALIFGESMIINFYHIRSVAIPSLLLAVPGALVFAFAIAALLYHILPYGWSWRVCLIFGAITCATDPVAVVAVLKRSGASQRITHTIIGESLLNDGVALALFSLFTENPGPENRSASYILQFTAKIVFVSPLVGAAFGLATLLGLAFVNNRTKDEDGVIQIALTFSCAYLSFFVAQYTLKVSGAIACVVAGFMLSHSGTPMVLHPKHMHSVWETVSWVGNTLIFMLAGVLIGSGTIAFIRGRDILYAFVTFLCSLAIRALIISILYWMLRFSAARYTVNESIFMSFVGLRGAVSVCLALSFVHSALQQRIPVPLSIARSLFIQVGGLVTLTLLQATLASLLLRCLKLLPESSETSEAAIIHFYVRKRIRLKAVSLLDEMVNRYPQLVAPSLVIKACSILHESGNSNESPRRHSPVQPEDFRSCAQSGLFDDVNIESGRHRSLQLAEYPWYVAHRQQMGNGRSRNPDGFQEAELFELSSDEVSFGEETVIPGLHAMGDDIAERMGTVEEMFATPSSLFPVASDVTGESPHAFLPSLPLHDDYLVVSRRSSSRIQISREDHAATSDTYHRRSLPASPWIPNERPDRAALIRIRRAFLDVLRTHYWRQVRSGRLPRLSSIVVGLLHSVEAGLDSDDPSRLGDWPYLCQHFHYMFYVLKTANLKILSRYSSSDTSGVAEMGTNVAPPVVPQRHRTSDPIDHSYNSHPPDHWFAFEAVEQQYLPNYRSLQHYVAAQGVYLLTSFVEAHLYAQRMLNFYLGDSVFLTEIGANSRVNTTVMHESEQAVLEAQSWLSKIDPTVVSWQLSKQTARWILHMEEDLIGALHEEGILTMRDRERLLHVVQGDFTFLRFPTVDRGTVCGVDRSWFTPWIWRAWCRRWSIKMRSLLYRYSFSYWSRLFPNATP